MQDLNDELRFIFEPLVSEILEKRPENVQEYMIHWLIKNRQDLRKGNPSKIIEEDED